MQSLALNEKQQELFDKHLKLVDVLACRYCATAGIRGSGIDDFRSVAQIALADCAARFDESRKCEFGSFVYSRVYGALRDESRRSQWVGSRTSLFKQRMASGLNPNVVIPFSAFDDQDDQNLLLMYEARPDRGSQEDVSIDDILKRVGCQQCREFIRLRVINELSIDDIAKVMGVGASRVSQIREKVRRLYSKVIRDTVSGSVIRA